MNLHNAQEQVKMFMHHAGQDCPLKPKVPDNATQLLRLKLHAEEAVVELEEAFGNQNIVEIADSIADSLVVVLGTAVACGIDIEPIFNEVMRSNMTKFIDGHRRDDGKWVKGPSYTPADLIPLLNLQLNAH